MSRMMPPSWYLWPSHSPLKVIGSPTFQSDLSSVPKKYCFTILGSVRPCQTFAAGALNVTTVFAVSVLIFRYDLVFLFLPLGGARLAVQWQGGGQTWPQTPPCPSRGRESHSHLHLY